MKFIAGVKYIGLASKAFVRYLRDTIRAVRQMEKQNKIIKKAMRGKKMANTDLKFKVLYDGQELPRGGILNNPPGEGLYQTKDWPVNIERIGEHFIVKAGCQKFVVHDYKEARKWLVAMADKHIQPMFDKKK